MRLGEKFLSIHPNLFSFISIIKEEEQYYANFSRGIRSGAIPFEAPSDTFML